MQCLVTGASGYLGRALVPALLAAGHRVTVTRHRAPAPDGVHGTINTDLSDRADAHAGRDVSSATSSASAPACARDDSVDRAGATGSLNLQGQDVVFHLAGIAHQRAESDDYRRLNLDGTVRLARCARSAGVRRFVFLSSVKAAQAEALADTGAAAFDYGLSKLAAESALREICADSAMELVIVRPALVYGGGESGHLRMLRRWVDLRLPRPPVGGCRSMIARDDLVNLLCILATWKGPLPVRLTVTDGERYSARRLHEALCQSQGRGPLLPSPPAAVWRLGAALFDGWRGEARGSTWERLTGSECYEREGLDALSFTPLLTFERSLGLS